MSSTSKPLFQRLDLHPGDLTSDDRVVWLMYMGWYITERATGLEDIIEWQASESLRINKFFFYAGDMPDRDPGSKERLVLAIYFCPYYYPSNKHWIEQTVLVHAKSFPNNHRAAFIFDAVKVTFALYKWSQEIFNVTGHFKSVLVRVRFVDWQVDERTNFNKLFGDLIRAGTDCVDFEELRGLEIIKYVLNHDRFRLEEEMISWNPFVSTKAGKVYKEDLATLVPGPLEKWRN
ncbi:hypothetical protein FA15DRAFT_665362 [Coprinopsis marcescibilis]|uniref:Uncharacterized protein n=1 Tax=Coprinopsis marcescibilis TaxID=230819 RepID=A0A5C3L5U6_COPMA|nr:hypothetical protein FA15DRAFT_665362 [Coprinopsis marcescibilis]